MLPKPDGWYESHAQSDLQLMKHSCDKVGVPYLEFKTGVVGKQLTCLVIGPWTEKDVPHLLKEDCDQTIIEFNEFGKMTGY